MVIGMNQNRFSAVVGQREQISALNFYLDAQNKAGIFPFLLFTGAKGVGKTNLARETTRYLLNSDGTKKPRLEVNCANLKNGKIFAEMYLSYIRDSQGLCLLLDEIHAMSSEVTAILLTLLTTDDNPIREFKYEGSTYSWDIRKINVVACSSENDKIFPPLIDRMTKIDLGPYSEKELGDILVQHIGGQAGFGDDLILDIVSTMKGNARACVKRALEIKTFLAQSNTPTLFSTTDWQSLRQKLGIKEMGMTNSELSVLRVLDKHGPSTLQMLHASTGLSRSCIRAEVENELLRHGFLKIEGLRKITQAGRELLERIDGKKPQVLPATI